MSSIEISAPCESSRPSTLLSPLAGRTEEELETTPFETYELFRGQSLGLLTGGSDLKMVGKLKCIVRVTEGDPDDEPLFVDKDNFESLAKAKARNEVIMTELLKVGLFTQALTPTALLAVL